jgi:general secretion pathway protein G
MTRTRNQRGFTLVEILIVVIILGILAAIVIPQFTNASQDARKNSLTSQLQTLRSQVELYKLQHLNVNGKFGPYLQTMPLNPVSEHDATDSGDVFVVTADVTGGGASGAGSAGWVYNMTNGKMWATSKTGAFVYDESDSQNTNNDN